MFSKKKHVLEHDFNIGCFGMCFRTCLAEQKSGSQTTSSQQNYTDMSNHDPNTVCQFHKHVVSIGCSD